MKDMPLVRKLSPKFLRAGPRRAELVLKYVPSLDRGGFEAEVILVPGGNPEVPDSATRLLGEKKIHGVIIDKRGQRLVQ
jgi:hypothetical protein